MELRFGLSPRARKRKGTFIRKFEAEQVLGVPFDRLLSALASNQVTDEVLRLRQRMEREKKRKQISLLRIAWSLQALWRGILVRRSNILVEKRVAKCRQAVLVRRVQRRWRRYLKIRKADKEVQKDKNPPGF